MVVLLLKGEKARQQLYTETGLSIPPRPVCQASVSVTVEVGHCGWVMRYVDVRGFERHNYTWRRTFVRFVRDTLGIQIPYKDEDYDSYDYSEAAILIGGDIVADLNSNQLTVHAGFIFSQLRDVSVPAK